MLAEPQKLEHPTSSELSSAEPSTDYYKHISPEAEISGRGFKRLTPKQTLQRLPVTLAHVKAGNTSENVLNEIQKIICSLYQAKELTKKVYDNIMNSVKVYYKMDTIFINSNTTCPSAPVRCTPVASPVDKFSEIATLVTNYTSPANK